MSCSRHSHQLQESKEMPNSIECGIAENNIPENSLYLGAKVLPAYGLSLALPKQLLKIGER